MEDEAEPRPEPPPPFKTPDDLAIRFATEADVHTVLHFIRALAHYEKLEHEVIANEAELKLSLFGPRPAAEVMLAELGGHPVGFALFFQSYSTFLARPGLYLEDLFVDPAMRGKGIGGALMAALARVAVERHYGRFEWSVLNWNEPSIKFYRSLGAKPMSEWTVERMTGGDLVTLAGRYLGPIR